MIEKEKFSVVCADGVVLKGLLIIPENPKAIVQFNGGTATKKEFYLPFLEYLATQNYLCCLWDYRGSGESAPENLAKCDYHFLDYGTKDMPTIKDYLTKKFPDLPFLLFAHSVGGQQAGFMNNLDGIKGMVGFAVSTGYLAHMPLFDRIKSAYFFFVFTPLSILFTGYLKAKKFGYMEDLPKNVVLPWRDWCMKPDYFFNRKFYGKGVQKGFFENMPFPIHIFWATDDYISNKKSIPSFWNNVKSAFGIDFTKIQPTDINEKSIGHFGFFKKSMETKLWTKAVEKLEAFLAK